MEYKHEITITPDTRGGERGWWTAAITTFDGVSYDGAGASISEALCDLADRLASALDKAGDA
jgi:hypothetical protein